MKKIAEQILIGWPHFFNTLADSKFTAKLFGFLKKASEFQHSYQREKNVRIIVVWIQDDFRIFIYGFSLQ